MQGGGPDPEVPLGAAPRSAPGLIAATFRLYRSYPLLFLALASAVVVPYAMIVTATTGDSPYSGSVRSAELEVALTALMWCLITPLISALHINAVAEVKEGRSPQFGAVFRAGLQVLPAVVAVSIMSGLGIFLGFMAFLIPGIYLFLRWVVVAQAAAIEHQGWLPAMRSSGRLVSENYGHVFIFLVCIIVVVTLPTILIGFGIGFAVGDASEVVQFLVGLVIEIVVLSFSALATALLYFDLRVRHEPAGAPLGTTPEGRDPDLQGSADEGQSKGWYVDPSNPRRMRYWAGESSGWKGSTKTPRKIRRQWEEAAAERKQEG